MDARGGLPSAWPCMHFYSVKVGHHFNQPIWRSARLQLLFLLAHNHCNSGRLCSVFPGQAQPPPPPPPPRTPPPHQGPQQSWWGWTWKAVTARAKAWLMCAYKLGAPLDARTGSKVLCKGKTLALIENAYSCAPKWAFGTRKQVS